MFMSPLQIQDVAEQGVMFVGFLQQPGGAPCFLGHWDPEELSSLHSSPSPIHRHPISANITPTDPTEPHQNGVEPECLLFEPQELDHETVECNTQPLVSRHPDFSSLKPTRSSELNTEELDEKNQTSLISLKESLESTNQPQNRCRSGVDPLQWYPIQNPADAQGNQLCPSPLETTDTVRQECSLPNTKESTEKHFNFPNQRERRGSSSDSWLSSPDLERNHDKTSDGRSSVTTHNNNHIRLKSSEKDKNATSPPAQARKYLLFVASFDKLSASRTVCTAANCPVYCVSVGMQLFALYNHTGELNTSLRFYSLRVPLRVQKEAGLITEVDAHWLDHMTQHFTSGAQLIDGFFHVGDDNGMFLCHTNRL